MPDAATRAPMLSKSSMRQETALVTGGTAGVGRSIVCELVRTGTFVHFIGTNADKGAAIEAELNREGDRRCTFIQLDLSSLAEVKDFTEAFKREVPELQVLANVAGVMLPTRQETPEGIEKTFAIGYLSVFLLCRELSPLLVKGSPSRIVNVSGGPALVLRPSLDFEKLDFRSKYIGVRTAIRTVHAKTVLTQILAAKLKSEGVDVNAFHPGTVKSDLGRHMPFPLSLAIKAASTFMSKTSKTGVYVSCAPELKAVSGQLFLKNKARPLSFEADYMDRLWKVSEAMLEEVLG